MDRKDILSLLALGLAIWIAGGIYYAYHGTALLETTLRRYWIAFAISPLFSAALCIAILRWRNIPPASWASAMLLLAIPGMLGEALVLSPPWNFYAKTPCRLGRQIRSVSVCNLCFSIGNCRGGYVAGGNLVGFQRVDRRKFPLWESSGNPKPS